MVDYRLDHECNETIILLLTILLVVKEVICSSPLSTLYICDPSSEQLISGTSDVSLPVSVSLVAYRLPYGAG